MKRCWKTPQTQVFCKGFKVSVMGHLNKGDEAKAALDDYLKLRPNLKTKEDYKKYLYLTLHWQMS